MDKKISRRPDKPYDQKGKRQQGKRSHELGTFEDVTRRPKTKQQKKNDNKTRCDCGGHLKPRGAVGCMGHLRSKCRKCGRTVWVRLDFKPPVPLVPTSKMARFGGMNVHMRQTQERVQVQLDEQDASIPQT